MGRFTYNPTPEMLYNLPNGKVIELSVEEFLEMSDEELEYLVALNYGEPIENPFFGSVLQKQPPPDFDDIPAVIIDVPIDPDDQDYEEQDRN